MLKTRLAWAFWIGLAVSFLVALSRLHAQTPDPVSYEVGIFRATDALGPTAAPFTLTTVPASQVTCGWPKTDGVANVPNPTTFVWDSPVDGSLDCRLSAPAIAIALPIGVGYRAGVRSVAADGTRSAWTFAATTFRRAPRGLPCAGGPGIQISGDADLNGQPVHITVCVNQ